ncbi:MAG TPA: M28 family metallopeptidase [Allosphingosinicella sp.]
MRFKTLLAAGIAAFAFVQPAAAQYHDDHEHGAQPAAAPAPAQPAAPAPAQIDDLEWQTELGFQPEAFRSHVMFLSDDLLEGRDAGSRGYELAARYVAAQFAGLGVLPANHGSWYQQVRLGRGTAQPGATLRIGDQSFTSGEGFVFLPGFASQPVAVDAPLVFVGYGLDAPSQGHDDYRGLDVRGKVVVMSAGLPQGLPSDVAAHLGSGRAQMAAARGAVGAIVLRPDAAAAQAPLSRLATFAGRPAMTWVNEQGNSGPPHQQMKFIAVVDAPAANAMFAGSRRSWAQVAADFAANRRPAGFALRPRVRAERTFQSEIINSPNVVGIIPGSDPSVANEYVVLMAHLDHVGMLSEHGQGQRPPGEGTTDRTYNGAMDNATGIATLIEVARQFNNPANRPRRPILLAAVTAEEKGLLGASYLANNPVVDGRIVGVVNLDMPILTYDFQDVVAFGSEHSEMGPMVERAARAMNVALSADPMPQEGLFTRSDHYPFVQAGVPSVFLMTGFQNGGEEKFRGFLGGNYHSVRDELNQPFNWRAGARFAELNFRIARELANAAAAPRWYQGSFFGDTLGGNQPRAPRPAAAAPAAAAAPSTGN